MLKTFMQMFRIRRGTQSKQFYPKRFPKVFPLETLLNIGELTNYELPCELIKNLMGGFANCGVTGRSGTGKTTVLRSMIEHTDPRITLRVMGDLQLREYYPYRNVITFSESDFLNFKRDPDVLYKTDAIISVIGEVCTDEVAAKMIEYDIGSSVCTLFTHFTSTTADLVHSLRNALCHMEVFKDAIVAEKFVVDFLDCDIHMSYNNDGQRYVERITEVIGKADEDIPVDRTLLDEYIKRNADKDTFITQDIIRYDLATNKYIVVNPLSDELVKKLLRNMDTEKAEAFKQFLAANF